SSPAVSRPRGDQHTPRSRAHLPGPFPASPGNPPPREGPGKAALLTSRLVHLSPRHVTRSTTMSNTTATEQPRTNGVDVSTLLATREAVRGTPEIAGFRFRAHNTWVQGTHSVSTIEGFYGVGQELAHQQPTRVVSDHPEVLVGTDRAPTPVEYLLHAI